MVYVFAHFQIVIVIRFIQHVTVPYDLNLFLSDPKEKLRHCFFANIFQTTTCIVVNDVYSINQSPFADACTVHHPGPSLRTGN